MSRPAWAEIDLKAYHHNLQVVRRTAPSSRVVAIIKANGYGHGIIRTANALPDADAFGVASIDEAMLLREAGIKQRIILLEGIFDADEFELVIEHNLDLVVHSRAQISLLKNISKKTSSIANHSPVSVWLKIDTGMHRLGLAPAEVDSVLSQLQALTFVRTPVIFMTHLAKADEINDVANIKQLECFDSIMLSMKSNQTQRISVDTRLEKSIANSAAVLSLPESHVDWVRPGIMLYGISPMSDKISTEFMLRPVMSVKSKLIDIREIAPGEAVGYGAQWVSERVTRVGVIAFGYGDGYPRHATNGTPVYINNEVVPLIGRVSMDMITVDLSNHKQAGVGDEVELWGKHLPVEKVAQCAGTIAYELVCGITQRVKFIEI